MYSKPIAAPMSSTGGHNPGRYWLKPGETELSMNNFGAGKDKSDYAAKGTNHPHCDYLNGTDQSDSGSVSPRK
jgi:hypothetical protein